MEGNKRKANEDFGEQIRKRLFGKTSLSSSNNSESILKASNKSSSEVTIPTVIKCEVLENDDRLTPSERALLRNAIDKTKAAAKKALSAKDKEIDEIKGEILKHKLEKMTYQEKYKKYKHFAETLKKRFDNSKVNELAEALSDLKCKGTLKDGLLHKEREENQKHLNQIALLQEKIKEMSWNEKKVEEERVKDIIKHSDKVNQLEEKTKLLREKLQEVRQSNETASNSVQPVREDSKKRGSSSQMVKEKAIEHKLIAKVEPYMSGKNTTPDPLKSKAAPIKTSLSPNASNLVTPLKIPKGKLDKKEYFESLLLLNDDQNDENITNSDNLAMEELSKSPQEREIGKDASAPNKEQTSKQTKKIASKISDDQHQLPPSLGKENALHEEGPKKNVPEKTPLKIGKERYSNPGILEETEEEIVENLLLEKDHLEEKENEIVEVLLVEKDHLKEEEIGFSMFEEDGLEPDESSESDTNEPSEKVEDLKDKIRELSEKDKARELSEKDKTRELSEKGKTRELSEKGKTRELSENGKTRELSERKKKVEEEEMETTPRAYDELLNRINDKLIEMAKKRS